MKNIIHFLEYNFMLSQQRSYEKILYNCNIFISQSFQVFISYQWDSKEKVKSCKEYLENNHIQLWFDEDNLECAGYLHPQLARGIELSELFLCFITEKYDKSVNCFRELNWAFKHNKKIIVVMLEEIDTKELKNIGILIDPLLRINSLDNKKILDEVLKTVS